MLTNLYTNSDRLQNQNFKKGQAAIQINKEVAMFISQAITIFMDYQKMNSGKKYAQKL